MGLKHISRNCCCGQRVYWCALWAFTSAQITDNFVLMGYSDLLDPFRQHISNKIYTVRARIQSTDSNMYLLYYVHCTVCRLEICQVYSSKNLTDSSLHTVYSWNCWDLRNTSKSAFKKNNFRRYFIKVQWCSLITKLRMGSSLLCNSSDIHTENQPQAHGESDSYVRYPTPSRAKISSFKYLWM